MVSYTVCFPSVWPLTQLSWPRPKSMTEDRAEAQYIFAILPILGICAILHGKRKNKSL